MSHETQISTEIGANPDWAAAVRRADGWAAEYLGQDADGKVFEWSASAKAGGEPRFRFRMAQGDATAEAGFGRADLDDRREFRWRVGRVWRCVVDWVIQVEFDGIKRALREWAEEETVAAEN